MSRGIEKQPIILADEVRIDFVARLGLFGEEGCLKVYYSPCKSRPLLPPIS